MLDAQDTGITFEIQLTSFGAVQDPGATGPDVQLKSWFQPQNFWQTKKKISLRALQKPPGQQRIETLGATAAPKD